MQIFEALQISKRQNVPPIPLRYERNVCMMYRQSPVACFDLYVRHKECSLLNNIVQLYLLVS